MAFKVEGIISAMVTPFTRGGTYVDFDKVGPLAKWLVGHGVHGLFVCGTTGEGPLLSAEERKEVLEEVLEAVGGKVHVIAHTGCLDTATTIELTCHARDCGATAAGVVTPSYFDYDDRSLTKFYKDVAGAAKDFPVLLYNIPSCAKNALSGDLVLSLGEEVDNIVGIKDSSGDMAFLTRLMGNAPKGFQVINGADDYGYQAFLAGALAAVSGMSNIAGRCYVALYNHLRKGNLKRAWNEQVRLEEICRVTKYGANLAVFKEGMRLQGFDPGYVRPPQRELTAAEKRQVKGQMERLKLL